MKARLFLLMSVIAVAAMGVAAVGCGGGGGSGGDAGVTPEEYFRQIEQLADGMGQQSDALASKWEEDLASVSSDQDRLELTSGFYHDLFSLVGDFRDGLADIEPPKEVEETHRDLVGIADEFSSAWSGISADVKNASSEAELEELLNDDEFVAAGQRFEQACFDLQGVADDMGIDVDLKCGD
jgi:hypothetical protein